jgi:hypothetical protein
MKRPIRLLIGFCAVIIGRARRFSCPSPATRRRFLAVSLVAALVAACGSTTVSPPPSSSAALPSLTSSPTPTPSSTAPVVVDEGMPSMVVPPAAIRMAPIPDSPGVQVGGTPTGPYAYLQGIGNRTLFVADAGGGSERAVPLVLAVGEQIDEVRTDGSWIVVAVSGPATPGASESGLTCRQQESQPRAWRILAAPLGADGLPSDSFRKIDAGVATRAFEAPGAQGLDCPYPAIPPVALAADRGRVCRRSEWCDFERVHPLAPGRLARADPQQSVAGLPDRPLIHGGGMVGDGQRAHRWADPRLAGHVDFWDHRLAA